MKKLNTPKEGAAWVKAKVWSMFTTVVLTVRNIIHKGHLTLGLKHHLFLVSHQQQRISKQSLVAPLAAFVTKKLALMNVFNVHNKLPLVTCQFLKNIETISLQLQTQNVSVLIYWPLSFLEWPMVVEIWKGPVDGYHVIMIPADNVLESWICAEVSFYKNVTVYYVKIDNIR